MSKDKFEESLERLEKIVEDLEAGKLSLEETLKRYEEGVKLSRFCGKSLQDAERKIEILFKDSAGELRTEDFDPDALEEDEEAQHPKSSTRKRKAREDQQD